jgi:hypothetical protein
MVSQVLAVGKWKCAIGIGWQSKTGTVMLCPYSRKADRGLHRAEQGRSMLRPYDCVRMVEVNKTSTLCRPLWLDRRRLATKFARRRARPVG